MVLTELPTSRQSLKVSTAELAYVFTILCLICKVIEAVWIQWQFQVKYPKDFCYPNPEG